jgi:hypothetical protein
MPITNVTSGDALASVTTDLALVAPTVIGNDIMVANIYTNDNVAVVAPLDWALIRADNNTTTMRSSLFWKRAGAIDSGATHTFTIAGTTVGFGIITAWRGALQGGNPFGNNTVSANGSSDTVTYATLTPQRAHGAVIAAGFYSNDLTTAGAIAGTDPTFANIVDVETTTGNDASIFVYWAVASGLATGERTHTTTSSVDGVNTGYLLELIAQVDSGSGSGTGSVKYPAVNRIQV